MRSYKLLRPILQNPRVLPDKNLRKLMIAIFHKKQGEIFKAIGCLLLYLPIISPKPWVMRL
jgi:hypothetical protein